MSGYNTEQKKLIIDFFSENPERSFTIDQVAAALCERGAPIGKSTVYRLIPRLTECGMLKKFSEVSGRKNLYQIVICEHRCEHFHMKCKICGKLFHMDCAISAALTEKLLAEYGFSADKENTVIFGVCLDCRSRDGEQSL